MPFEKTCPVCGMNVSIDTIICPYCGSKIGEEKLERILPFLKRDTTPEPVPLGTFRRIYGVLRYPASTFRDIALRPAKGSFFIIMLFALLNLAFMLIAVSHIYITETVYVTVGNSTVPQVVDSSILLSNTYGPSGLLIVFGWFIPMLLTIIIIWFIGSFFAWLAYKFAGGTGKYKHTLNMIAFTMVPLLLLRTMFIPILIVGLPNIQYGGSEYTFDALNTLIVNNPIWGVLNALTAVGLIWAGFLLIFGIREVHKTPTLHAVILAIISTAVMIGVFLWAL